MNGQSIRAGLAAFVRAPLAWSRRSAHHRSLAAAVVVGGVSLAAAFARVMKDLALANWFGTHREVGAYLLAIALPLFATSVLAGSFNSALIPVYLDVRRSAGERAGAQVLGSVLALVALTLTAVTALLLIFGPSILTLLMGQRGPEEVRLASSLSPLLVPIVLANGVSIVLGGILNTTGSFALPALTPAASSLVPLAALLLLPGRRTITWVAEGTLAGYLIEAVILAIAVRRAHLVIFARGGETAAAMARVLKAYWPMFAGMVVSCTSPIVDQFMSTRLGESAVATLGYGGKVPTFVMALGAGAVGTAVLPHFSQLSADGNWAGMRRSLRTWTLLIVVASLPILLASALFAHPLIRLLFERGAFHAKDADLTAKVFLAYLPQLPFYVLGILGCRLLSALRRNRIMMFIAFLGVVINFVGDYVLMSYLGLPGIALSTSLVYLVTTSLVFLALRDVAFGSANELVGATFRSTIPRP